MELIERREHLNILYDRLRLAKNENGHTLFLAGEAGAGKTSLINYFLKSIENQSVIYIGACDALFTPRPLGPLYDIAASTGSELFTLLRDEKKNRALIFTSFLQRLNHSSLPVILVFEDIHWADEATLDLIKFLTRRIDRLKCLFILTYRSEEVTTRGLITSMFNELPPHVFSKLVLEGFSKETVDALAKKRGYDSGERVYTLTGGNPFFTMEILANYSRGIPERIKDSILSVFESKQGKTKELWEFLSILPSSHIDDYISNQLKQEFRHHFDECVATGVILTKPGHLSFKHDLYRLIIEGALSPYKRISLHKKILKLMRESPSENKDLSQLVHHARYAEERESVAQLAPKAAREAALLGAHSEASNLYATAIAYTSRDDSTLVELYERHAYECYLTNQISKGIVSQQQALEIWRARKVSLKVGDTLRFLSRLMWYNGSSKEAMALALEAVQGLENGFPTRERALAYSNVSQLYMLAGNRQKTLEWGEKAITLATKMEDHEVLSHTLNNVGSALMNFDEVEGEEQLLKSLSIALENKLHEHAARAYTNLLSFSVLNKRYSKAIEYFTAGITYCEDNDLDSWRYYMLGEKTRYLLETGNWQEAETIASSLWANSSHPNIIKIVVLSVLARLRIRHGDFAEARALITEGKKLASLTREAYRIIPLLASELELCWITGDTLPLHEVDDAEQNLFAEKNNSRLYAEFAYWKHKCRLITDKQTISFAGPFAHELNSNWKAASKQWKILGCIYEYAIALFYTDDEALQKQSIHILTTLRATATCEMLKLKLKMKGVRNIPKGPRESTLKNPAHLTNRQIDVLKLLQEGLQNNEIAERLFLSPKTVDHHIAAILSKLEVNSRAKAVIKGKSLGILG